MNRPSSVIRQTFPLGAQWPTVDPFLFCAHHRDSYPAGTDQLGPAAALVGRAIGSDFDGVDGWNMYHGSTVPGFPQHPHRGFETITYVREGLIDHSDSLGAAARFGAGDTQWLTAGGGVVHAEMFPLVHRDRPNPLELFQIWLNLPAASKMVAPYFTMRWAENLTKVPCDHGNGELAVIVGACGPTMSEPPPPNSWAAADSEVAIWHVSLDVAATMTLPTARHANTIRVIYLFDGPGLDVGDDHLAGSHGAVIRCDQTVALRANDGRAECLIMQGAPIGEPVARYGPFVMNTEEQIRQAFGDYRRTQFGGWPWPTDGPVRSAETRRYALHPDGRTEHPDDIAPGSGH